MKKNFESGGIYTPLWSGNQNSGFPVLKKNRRKEVEMKGRDLQGISSTLTVSVKEIPCYHEYVGEIPIGVLPFNECMSSTETNKTVHFYIDDRLFLRVFRHPENYVTVLSRFPSVIAPDFSIRVGMTKMEIAYSIAVSRTVADYLYANGVKVIPNIQWCVPEMYDLCFDGIPKHGVVAVNCTGIIGCDASKYLWQCGYKEMLKRLDPSCIIRYGDKLPCEDEGRSVYFSNERLLRLRGNTYGS